MRKRNKKFQIIKLAVLSSLVLGVTLNCVCANGNDDMTKAERELLNTTEITDEDIDAKIPQFTKDYLEDEKQAQDVLDELNDAFVTQHQYYQNNIDSKSYDEIKKECRIVSDTSISDEYTTSYSLSTYTYQNHQLVKKQQVEKTVFDTPIYNTQLTQNYFREAYSAYKTYSQYDETAGLNDQEIFKNYLSQFLNALKNEDGFFTSCIKAHVNTLYYDQQGNQTNQESFETYKQDLLKKTKAQALLDEYDAKCTDYNQTYLSQVGYDHYLKSINNTRDTWKYSEYCKLAKKGVLANVPSYPSRPKNYQQLKQDAGLSINEVTMHQQMTYTLCQSETPQVVASLNTFQTPQEKVLSWAYNTLDSLYKNDISFNEPVITIENKNTYHDILNVDYKEQFNQQRSQIIDSLKNSLANQYRLKDYGQKITENAKSKLGCRYYWGATGESMFDCSGLVYWVMNHSGIKIERLTANGYANSGTEIKTLDEMIPGDVIALGDDQSYGHIGIYIGNGEVIESMGEGETCLGNHPQHVVKTTGLSHFIHEDKKYEIRRLF